MRFSNSKNKLAKKVEELNQILNDYTVSKSLSLNVIALKQLFEDDDTIITRSIVNNNDNSFQCCLFYCNGLVDSFMINENIIKPIMLSNVKVTENNLLDLITNQIILVSDVKKTDNIKQIIESIAYGDTVLFIDSIDKALILNTKYFQARAITEPENEKALSGPREGFTESLVLNLSLIHRKIRTNNLKMRYINIGKQTNTQACICYMDNIVNKKILNELYKRLDKIEIDGVLDTNYISELIQDSPFSLFRTTGVTERPDVVVSKILEGRIALLIDGTPIVLTIPYLFIENFQTSEDYYLNFYYTSFTRIIRILGFILTTCIPAFYIAIVAYHHEMLPTNLFINITMERQNAPLPAALECFFLLIIFDILKEAGIRMPSNIGQALSIVGALVIGQAAVEAKLVAAPMIIVVASTGITSLLTPKLNAPIIFIRFIFLILASVLGFYGLFLGISWLIIHLISLRSLGIPQIIASGDLKYQDIKDNIIRLPWSQMLLRPNKLTKNRKRMRLKND